MGTSVERLFGSCDIRKYPRCELFQLMFLFRAFLGLSTLDSQGSIELVWAVGSHPTLFRLLQAPWLVLHGVRPHANQLHHNLLATSCSAGSHWVYPCWPLRSPLQASWLLPNESAKAILRRSMSNLCPGFPVFW